MSPSRLPVASESMDSYHASQRQPMGS